MWTFLSENWAIHPPIENIMDHITYLINRKNLHCHIGSLLIGFPVADFIALYCYFPSTSPIFSHLQPAFCYDAFLVETKKPSYANFVWVDIWENLSSKLLCLLLSYFHSLCKIRIVCLFFVSRWGKIQRWGSPVPGFLILFLTLPFSLVY